MTDTVPTRTEAHVDAVYAFAAALADLLDTIETDLLPPPINIGWRTEHADRLVVQIAGTDRDPWLKSLQVADQTRQLHPSTALIVEVTGRLVGKDTTIVLLYDRPHTARERDVVCTVCHQRRTWNPSAICNPCTGVLPPNVVLVGPRS